MGNSPARPDPISYNRSDARIHGLGEKEKGIVIIETYPRKTADMLGLAPLPSKRKEPLIYIHHVWGFLKSIGFRYSAVVTPSVDQVDAMPCAIAAQAYTVGGTCWKAMGSAPFIDLGNEVIREGFIICPTKKWLKSIL